MDCAVVGKLGTQDKCLIYGYDVNFQATTGRIVRDHFAGVGSEECFSEGREGSDYIQIFGMPIQLSHQKPLLVIVTLIADSDDTPFVDGAGRIGSGDGNGEQALDAADSLFTSVGPLDRHRGFS
jgi:hypothetical protein